MNSPTLPPIPSPDAIPAEAPGLPSLPPAPTLPEAPHPADRRVWRKRIIALAVLGVIYAQAPYRIALNVKSAVKEGRLDVMEKYVNFNSVGTSMVSQIERRAEMDPPKTTDPAWTTRYRTPGYLTQVVEDLLQPKKVVEFSRVIQTNGTFQARTSFPFFTGLSEFTATVRDVKFRYPFVEPDSLGPLWQERLSVELAAVIPEARLKFEFSNWEWKLTGVEIPRRMTYSLTPIIAPPQIVEHPENLTIKEGQSGRLRVSPGGMGPFTYQWYHEGTEVARATRASLDFGPAQPSHAGNYVAVVSNPGGSATSAPVVVVVADLPPPPPPADWTGVWLVNSTIELTLRQNGATVQGTLKAPQAKVPSVVSGRASGDALSGSFSTRDGTRTLYYSLSLTMAESRESFSGEIRSGSLGTPFVWTGQRKSAAR